MALFKSIIEFCDVVSFLAYCQADSSLLLTLESTTSEYWFPTSKVGVGESWDKVVQTDIQETFGVKLMPSKVLRITKFWIPEQLGVSSLYVCIFELQVTLDQKKKARGTFGKYKGKVRWVSDSELAKLLANRTMKSPEVYELFTIAKFGDGSQAMTNAINNLNIRCDRFIYRGSLVEVPSTIIPPIKSLDPYDQLVENAHIDKSGQEVLYKEFLFLCYPACYMSIQVFTRFLLECKWSKEEAPNLFRTADAENRNGLTFTEFLHFIAASEPSTAHGGMPAEIRSRYIFRYFDKDRDNLLNSEEFKTFVFAGRQLRKQSLDNQSVAREAGEYYRSMGMNEGHAITVAEFLKAVGELKIRGTSQFFRAPVTIQMYLRDVRERNFRAQEKAIRSGGGGGGVGGSTRGSHIDIGGGRNMKGGQVKGPMYELAVHTVKIERSGANLIVQKVASLEAAISVSSTKQPTLSGMGRKASMDIFSSDSIPNDVVQGLRQLHNLNKKPVMKNHKPTYVWGTIDSVSFGKNIIRLCEAAKEIIKSESRLLELNAPVYIMGDLHGNFVDLLYFEKVLWPIGPGLCPCTLLFLGDYVDRGSYSIEVISYLFSCKVQSPTKIYLVRGNHEIREVQKMFTFYNECLTKFGDKLGEEIWNAVNNVFDVMPLAATIDGRVFCCHGGIPPPWLCPVVTAINDIPVMLNQPDEQSSLAWELMWNDPVKTKLITEKTTLELLANEGFAANERRGTAHVFSSDAVDRFLKANGFSHIVRAHEVVQPGFQLQQKAKLLTVFSSSKYCGGDNEAACVLADQQKLRILRLETE